jgi:phosphoglycerate-specific signal transduction histidine kinase
MDKTIQRFLRELQSDIDGQLQALGDRPKENQFEHGTQVGVYRGLQQALSIMKVVLSTEEQEEAQR